MKQTITTILLTLSLFFISFLLIRFPDEVLDASVRGLNMWWEIVFPSLLPFFITAELLIGFGIVTFIGALFEPIMRPLFNVPGVGSFAWIMGMASGYPSGAKISVRLREEDKLTKTEAERLISFTNASSPLFIFGAISVGFFHDAKLGLLIATCHYVSNVLVGLCMRFYGRGVDKKNKKDSSKQEKPFSILKAFKAMHRERLENKKPFGEILGNAVLNSIQTLVMIGGFIILFSVLTKLFFLIDLTPLIASSLEHLFKLLTLPISLTLPFVSGLFEITIGAQLISQFQNDTLLFQVIMIGFILGFNGLSVQAQVSSIIATTDIRFAPYFFARILHGVFAAILTIILYEPLYASQLTFQTGDIPVVNGSGETFWELIMYSLHKLGPIVTILSLAFYIVIVLFRKWKIKKY